MRQQFTHGFESIISYENLLAAWREFIRGKANKPDVQKFNYRLSDNIQELHQNIKNKQYHHGAYQAFNISDPKPRNIHKASVKDRVLHHAVYRRLYPFFEKTFITDSFSCRKDKGTHKAMNRFRIFIWQVSQNNTKTGWVLKCDIKKFFASIDQLILLGILQAYISNKDILWLLKEIISSFHSVKSDKGLPLGNLTSQLLVNIYMNEFDQYVKHNLKVKHYIRYADDFVILSKDRNYLKKLIPEITTFLDEALKLQLHPDKVYIKTIYSGVDFLGWVHFFNHRVLRTATKRRMLKKLSNSFSGETRQSYLGLLAHGNTRKLQENFSPLYEGEVAPPLGGDGVV